MKAMCKLQATIKRTQGVSNSIFHKILSFFSCSQLQGTVYPPTVILYEVLPEVYPLIVRSDVNNRIRQLEQEGYLIVVIEAKEPISGEYIGKMTAWNELVIGDPVVRMIEVGYFDKTASVP